MNGVSVGRHSRRELDPGDQSLDLQARIVLGVADRGYKLTEEMGIIAETAPEEIARIAPGLETGWEHVRLYRTRHDGALRFPAAEVDAVMWFPLAEIAAWLATHPADFTPGFQEC